MTEKQDVQVETVEKILVVGKESTEVVTAVSDLIEDIKAGKDVAVIATENLPNLVTAIDGFQQLSKEMQHKSRNATVAYAGYKVANALMPVE